MKFGVRAIQSERLVIATNDECNAEELRDFINSLIDKISEYVPWKNISRAGLRTIWIHSFEGSFADLLSQLKDKNFKATALLTESTDTALVLTLMDGVNRTNYVSGGMTKEEIKQKYAISGDKIPENMLLVDMDYISVAPEFLKANSMKSFFLQSFEFAFQKANLTREVNNL